MAGEKNPDKPRKAPREGLEWQKVRAQGGGYVWREVKKASAVSGRPSGTKIPSPLGGASPGENPSVRDNARSRGENPHRAPTVDALGTRLNKAPADTVQSYALHLTAKHYEDPDLQGIPEGQRRSKAAQRASNDLLEASRGGKSINFENTDPDTLKKMTFSPQARPATEEEKVGFSRLKSTKKTTNKEDQNVYDKMVAERSGRPLTESAKAQIAKKTNPKLAPGQLVAKGKLSPQDFIYQADPGEREWMMNQMQNPNGLFFGSQGNQVPGAYRRLQRYTNARQDQGAFGPGQGAPKAPVNGDDSGIVNWLQYDGRGKSSSVKPAGNYKGYTDKAVSDVYTQGIQKQGVKAADKTKSMAPSHEDFGVGIAAPGVPSLSKLESQFPNLSDQDLVTLRQSYKESAEQFVVNQKQSIENQRAQTLGKDATDSTASSDDRVVFFTTSIGAPALSVSANSLVGQYIIQKRKQMLVDTKQKTRAQVKGEFPAAVRDQHVFEVATGVSLGAQGRYGAFKHVGYRAGSKKSKGFGKMQPFGAQVVKDSSGQPIYDANGNVRYTEGYTRPFDVRPSNDLGLRVYIG